MERAFAADQFSKAYPPFNAFCAILLAATTMLGQGSPNLFYGTTAAGVMIVVILAARVWLHSLEDQARALLLFGRGWAGIVVTFCCLGLLKMFTIGPGRPVSVLALTGVAALWALVPLYTRMPLWGSNPRQSRSSSRDLPLTRSGPASGQASPPLTPRTAPSSPAPPRSRTL